MNFWQLLLVREAVETAHAIVDGSNPAADVLPNCGRHILILLLSAQRHLAAPKCEADRASAALIASAITELREAGFTSDPPLDRRYTRSAGMREGSNVERAGA
jgi:hypothetical protein